MPKLSEPWQEKIETERYTLYLGDCLEVLPTLQAGSVDAVLTDPPYGVELSGKRTKRSASLVNIGYSNLADNDDTISTIVLPAIQICLSIANRTLIMPGTRAMWRYPTPSDIGGVFNPSGAGLGRWGFTCIHPILYYGKCPYLACGMGHRPNGFADIAAGEVIEGHPCPKPLRWMEWLVNKASAKQSDTILDPFMGSGTTGIACINLGRKFIGVEIDPNYFAIAAKRISEARLETPAERALAALPRDGTAGDLRRLVAKRRSKR